MATIPPPLPLPLPPPPPHQPQPPTPLAGISTNSAITTLSKLNPTTIILTHIPPFLRHPRNLRDLLYSTTTIKHVFYSCPIKRFSNDNNQDDANENVIAVVKFSHSGNALSIVRNWKFVQQKLNTCKMKAFLLYAEGSISLHPERSQVDAGMIESVWELTHKGRELSTEMGKVAQQADDNMINTLVDAYLGIEKRQTELDQAALEEGEDGTNGMLSNMDDPNNNNDNNNNDGNNNNNTTEDSLKLDSAKVRAAAGGGAYDEDADPLNAPEVLEAVKQFKKKLEITQGGFRRKRREYVDNKLKEEIKKAKERLIQRRKEEEEKKQQMILQQHSLPPPPPVPMNLPPPPLPPGGLPPPPMPNAEGGATTVVRDTGRRRVSNLPAWMTAGKTNDDDDENKKRSADDMNDNEKAEEEPLHKKKFIPSGANREINARKERLVVDGGNEGSSLAAIRAANEAADRVKKEQEERVLFLKEAKIWPNDKILTGFYPKLHKPEIVPEIRKFVKEQMVEYLGEEEATLIDFVMNHLGKHENSNGFKGKNVDGLLEEMKMVLEEDAEAFVVDLFKKVVDISLE